MVGFTTGTGRGKIHVIRGNKKNNNNNNNVERLKKMGRK
jgi:hypothetical protein